MGNRLNRDGQVVDSTFDAANRLTEDQDFTYAYDLNGNLETKTAKVGGVVTDYTWDAEDRLARIDLPGGGFADYVYDGLGRRIQKDVSGAVTRYVYDGAAILLEYDGTNFLLARYTHGPGIDDPVMVERDIDTSGAFDASERFFYQTDGLGSVTELTDSTGVVARTIVYDSYGRIAQDTGGVEQPFAFTGRELDAESGLYFYRARYYDPAAGRFLSEDPIGFGAGDANVYRYVLSNPVNLNDPFGFGETLLIGTGISLNLIFGAETSVALAIDLDTGDLSGILTVGGGLGLGAGIDVFIGILPCGVESAAGLGASISASLGPGLTVTGLGSLEGSGLEPIGGTVGLSFGTPLINATVTSTLVFDF